MTETVLETQRFVFVSTRKKWIPHWVSTLLYTIPKIAQIQAGHLLLGEISREERPHCWKVLNAKAIHHEDESK